MKREANKYDGVMVMLHWVIGVGIILLAGTELFRQEFPKGHFIREGLRFIHQPAGTVLFALILVRLVWRMTLAKVPSPQQPHGFGEPAAKIVHTSLYGLMVAIPLLLFAAGMDTVVSTQAIEEFALRLTTRQNPYAEKNRQEMVRRAGRLDSLLDLTRSLRRM